MAIADLAAVLVAVRAGLGGDCVRAGSHLEMGEIDLLSARDAVEKARLDIDLAGPMVADVLVTVPLSVGSVVLRSAASESLPVTAGESAVARSTAGRVPGRPTVVSRSRLISSRSSGWRYSQDRDTPAVSASRRKVTGSPRRARRCRAFVARRWVASCRVCAASRRRSTRSAILVGPRWVQRLQRGDDLVEVDQ